MLLCPGAPALDASFGRVLRPQRRMRAKSALNSCLLELSLVFNADIDRPSDRHMGLVLVIILETGVNLGRNAAMRHYARVQPLTKTRAAHLRTSAASGASA